MEPKELIEAEIDLNQVIPKANQKRRRDKSMTCFIALNPSNQVKREMLLKGIEKLQSSLTTIEVQVLSFGNVVDEEEGVSGLYELLQLPQIDCMAQAYNHAVKNCDSEYLVFCDPGVWLETIDYQTTLNALEGFDAVTPHSTKVSCLDQMNDIDGEAIRPPEQMLTPGFSTHFFAIRRSAFEYLGGWDTKFSDPWLCHQAFSHVLTRSCATICLQRPIYQLGGVGNTSSSSVEKGYLEEIHSFSGKALVHYRKRLIEAYHKNLAPKISAPLPHFVLAITTYNRLGYLQKCVESWLATRSSNATWELIVADDGSSDGTLSYLRRLKLGGTRFTLIKNQRTDIIHQTNTILKHLQKTTFDLCFKCDDDIIFQQEGWDELYWSVIQRTGYQHLVYYNLAWRPALTKPVPHAAGQLVSYCEREHLQGAFFTVTPKILQEVGFFDAQQLGFRGYEHNDFSIRCCRAGFNSLEHPFDIQDSNHYIDLQGQTEYVRAMSSSMESKLHQAVTLAQKRRVLYQNRIFVPFHQIHRRLDEVMGAPQEDQKVLMNGNSVYRMADDRWVSGRGVSGWLGSLLKKIYNLCLRNSWFWGPRMIKRMGLVLLRIGKDLVNIDH